MIHSELTLTCLRIFRLVRMKQKKKKKKNKAAEARYSEKIFVACRQQTHLSVLHVLSRPSLISQEPLLLCSASLEPMESKIGII